MNTPLYAVVDPTTGHEVTDYPAVTDETTNATLDAAAKAHRAWSKPTTVTQRAELSR